MAIKDAVSRAISRLADRHDLAADESEEAFAQVMRGEASPIQMSALLMGLRAKGEKAAEVVGAVRALRGAMMRMTVSDGESAVDTCGTGGGVVTTFNISTAAAFVAAGAGVRVAKHGNRSFTSQSGSADVLEALGVMVPQTAGDAARLLDRCGMTFLFAPLFHPAMRHVGPIRRELGVGTIMNMLGPLANPAGVRRQVVGVADEGRAQLIADALADLDCDLALVVHARVGMDEIAPSGPTDMWEVRPGEVKRWTLEPDTLEMPGGGMASLAGGTPAENAVIVREILAAEDQGPRRTAVLLNAAAALVVAGAAKNWEDAVVQATDSIEGGAGMMVLDEMVAGSRALTADG
jgi:anthranilate phosphoribosyltransferase